MLQKKILRVTQFQFHYVQFSIRYGIQTVIVTQRNSQHDSCTKTMHFCVENVFNVYVKYGQILSSVIHHIFNVSLLQAKVTPF